MQPGEQDISSSSCLVGVLSSPCYPEHPLACLVPSSAARWPSASLWGQNLINNFISGLIPAL